MMEARNIVAEKIEYKRLFLICSIYAIFYTFCLYKNGEGITFPLFIAGTAAVYLYYLKLMGKVLKPFSKFYFVSIGLMAVDVCITANAFMIFFDKAFIFLLFFMLFMHNIYDDRTWDFGRYLKALVKNINTLPGFLRFPFFDISDMKQSKEFAKDGDSEISGNGERPAVYYVFMGLLISVPLLCIILPLLISSDVMFSDFMDKLFSFSWDWDVIGVLIMIVAVFFLSYAMVYRLSIRIPFLQKPVMDKRVQSPIIAITVNIVLLAIYMTYCMIQIIYLFLRKGNLPGDYTYTRYAHEGFFQLVFVCLINIVLVLVCRKHSRDSKVLKIVLCLISGCTYIMIASSAYRMYLYIAGYKLTYLRAFVLWALFVMAVIMAGVIMYLYRPEMNFVRFCTVSVISLWIVFVMINPDYRIAKYNIIYHDDTEYILELSLDAVPAIEKYADDDEILEKYLKKYDYSNVHDDLGIEKKTPLTLRTFNFSIWRAQETE